MNTLLQQVWQMHVKFRIDSAQVPWTPEEKKFRIKAFLEEVTEFEDAVTDEEELDALIDLVVFALGAVERHGWANIFDEAFGRVMDANMQKRVGGNMKRDNYQLDLFKPEGWEAATFEDLV